MRYLIVVRGAEFEADKVRLSDRGRETFCALSHKIKGQVGNLKVLIMSSDDDRAVACAAILGEVLGIGFDKYRMLFSSEQNAPDLEGVMALVKAREAEADTIVLVTHHGIARFFPTHYARENGRAVNDHSIPKAHARILDCKNYEVVHVSGS